MADTGDGTGTGTTSGIDNGDGTGSFTPGGGNPGPSIPAPLPFVPSAPSAYAIDGIPLDNPAYGWRVKGDGTNPFGDRSRTLTDFNTSGRDGTIQVRGFTATPTITLKVTAPASTLEDLRALFTYGQYLSLTSDPATRQRVELVSMTPTTIRTAAGGLYALAVILRCPEVYWRDVATTDYGPIALTANGQQVTPFPASTGPVRDALISIRGSITGVAVQGAAGTFFSYPPAVPSGTYLTLDSSNGRAWTGGSPFVKATEVTGDLANGRGPYFLELAPSSNPALQGLPFTATWSAASGATVTVRGRNAYDR